MSARVAVDSSLNVSVIIPVYNGGEAFVRCIEHLCAASPQPYEVIVVADGGKNGMAHLEEQGIRVLETPRVGGPAIARNMGAQHARGNILYFVDADVLIPRDAIQQVVDMFAQDPSLTALIGSYDDAPSQPNFLSQYRNLLHHYVHQVSREEASTFWGACGAIKRAAFLEVGGFNEGYRHPSIEDIELGYRLKQEGMRIRLCKALQVKHLKKWDASSIVKTDFFWRALPWSELLLKNGEIINDLNLQTSSRLSVAFCFILLFSLITSIFWLPSLIVAGGMAALLFGLNFSTYRFFYQKRGLWFALKVIPWHWFYFCYSGIAFILSYVKVKGFQKWFAGKPLQESPAK